MANDLKTDERVDAPAQYRTPQRPGQTGDAAQRQDGPSPLSTHPTGPHAPYEPRDPAGFATGKHVKTSGFPEENPPEKPGSTPSGTISVPKDGGSRSE